MSTAPIPLFRLFLEKGLISQDQWAIAQKEADKTHLPYEKILVKMGFLSEMILQEVLAKILSKQTVDLSHTILDQDALSKISPEMARQWRLLPIAWDTDTKTLIVATPNPYDLMALDRLRHKVPEAHQIEAQLCSDRELDRAIDKAYGYTLSIDGILHEIETGQKEARPHNALPEDMSQPVVRLIDAFIFDAVKKEASDIHFEPENGFIRIRYRIDGLLVQIRALHHAHWQAMAVRLKLISGMDIAESRAPQDGRLSLHLLGHEIDFRVSAQPTLYGENIVLRILDRHKGLRALETLISAPANLTELRRMMARPEGIILVTGPTGSGKTTTLYAMLQEINHDHVNIMTLEDPVEYPIGKVRQTSVTELSKLDFANGIRSILRQDPDVILVGEIRDEATAQMALRAAMTGHQVYATLHTNSALGAIPRLRHLGLSPDLLSGHLIGLIAQRLLRALCPQCKTPKPADAHEKHLLGIGLTEEMPTIFQATGCPSCAQTGYKGRFALLEIVKIDGTMDDMIAQNAPMSALKTYAHTQGFLSLAAEGARCVLSGKTSIEELIRVVDMTERMSNSN